LQRENEAGGATACEGPPPDRGWGLAPPSFKGRSGLLFDFGFGTVDPRTRSSPATRRFFYSQDGFYRGLLHERGPAIFAFEAGGLYMSTLLISSSVLFLRSWSFQSILNLGGALVLCRVLPRSVGAISGFYLLCAHCCCLCSDEFYSTTTLERLRGDGE